MKVVIYPFEKNDYFTDWPLITLTSFFTNDSLIDKKQSIWYGKHQWCNWCWAGVICNCCQRWSWSVSCHLERYYFDLKMTVQLNTVSSGWEDVKGTSRTVAIRALMTSLPVKLSLVSPLLLLLSWDEVKKTHLWSEVNKSIHLKS